MQKQHKSYDISISHLRISFKIFEVELLWVNKTWTMQTMNDICNLQMNWSGKKYEYDDMPQVYIWTFFFNRIQCPEEDTFGCQTTTILWISFTSRRIDLIFSFDASQGQIVSPVIHVMKFLLHSNWFQNFLFEHHLLIYFSFSKNGKYIAFRENLSPYWYPVLTLKFKVNFHWFILLQTKLILNQ